MFPFRYRSIFRSRWIALLWAGGICWTAIDVAGWSKADDAAATTANGAVTNQAVAPDPDLSALENQVRSLGDAR